MRSVRRATWTRAEPVSVSCVLYFSSVGALSKAIADELSPPGGGLSVAKVIEHGKLASCQGHVKGAPHPNSRLNPSFTSLNVERAKINRIATRPKRRMYSRVRELNGLPFAATAMLSRI